MSVTRQQRQKINEEIQSSRSALARKVIEAVKAEHLGAPPDNPEDEAYTQAVEDALTALHELFRVEGLEVG